MRQDAWRLDPSTRTAERLSDCPLTLNAIAKGYIVERACQAALDPGRGVRGLLLNVGGDLRVCGDAVQHDRDRVARRATRRRTEPLTTIEVRDRAVATSGNSQRGLRINGRWYSHIFDPRTGRPVERTVERDGHRRTLGRRRCARDDLQRALRRGEPAAWRSRCRASSA